MRLKNIQTFLSQNWETEPFFGTLQEEQRIAVFFPRYLLSSHIQHRPLPSFPTMSDLIFCYPRFSSSSETPDAKGRSRSSVPHAGAGEWTKDKNKIVVIANGSRYATSWQFAICLCCMNPFHDRQFLARV